MKDNIFGGPTSEDIMKKHVVMMFTFHDWNLYDVASIATADTYAEAIKFIREFQPPPTGLYHKFYVYSQVGEVHKETPNPKA